MSDPAPLPIYSIDSSSLMEWQGRYYPTDVFPSLAAIVDELAAAGRMLAPALVKEEIDAVGTAGLIDWTENHLAYLYLQPKFLPRRRRFKINSLDYAIQRPNMKRQMRMS